MLVAGVLLVASILIAYSQVSFGSITKADPTPVGTIRNFTFFASSTAQVFYATSTQATSTQINQYVDSNNFVDKGYFVIAGAKKVTLFFERGGATTTNNGESYFRVQTSKDGTDWDDYGKLMLATTTTTNLVSRVNINASVSTTTAFMNTDFGSFYAIRCITHQRTDLIDGRAWCNASATW